MKDFVSILLISFAIGFFLIYLAYKLFFFAVTLGLALVVSVPIAIILFVVLWYKGRK